MSAGVSSSFEPLKFLASEDVVRVAGEFGTPVFVYDENSIRSKVQYLQSLPSAFGHTIRYSIKACPSRAIVRLFNGLGTCFDASSIWEVFRAMRAGVPPSNILLTAQQADFTDDLLSLLDNGLKFDAGSLRQLEEFGKARRGSNVSVRVNPGFGSGLVRRLTSGGADSSFGIWHEDLPDVKEIVDRYDLRVERLHTHIGSGHFADVLLSAARLLLMVANDFPNVGYVNLGGGYRIEVFKTDPHYDHREWVTALADEISQFEQRTGRALHVEMEPGTFIMANSGSIIAEVIDVVSTGLEGRNFIKINAGLTEILRPSYYGSLHPLVAVKRDGSLPDESIVACVAGHCCIAGDVLTTAPGALEELQPMSLGAVNPGDFVVIERSGAYCSSMAMKNFNSYPEAAEVLRRMDGSYNLIRRRQELENITMNEIVPLDL